MLEMIWTEWSHSDKVQECKISKLEKVIQNANGSIMPNTSQINQRKRLMKSQSTSTIESFSEAQSKSQSKRPRLSDSGSKADSSDNEALASDSIVHQEHNYVASKDSAGSKNLIENLKKIAQKMDKESNKKSIKNIKNSAKRASSVNAQEEEEDFSGFNYELSNGYWRGWEKSHSKNAERLREIIRTQEDSRNLEEMSRESSQVVTRFIEEEEEVFLGFDYELSSGYWRGWEESHSKNAERLREIIKTQEGSRNLEEMSRDSSQVVTRFIEEEEEDFLGFDYELSSGYWRGWEESHSKNAERLREIIRTLEGSRNLEEMSRDSSQVVTRFIEIGTMNTPKQLETGQTDKFNGSVVPVSSDRSPTKCVKQTSHENHGNKSSSPTEERKKISDTGLRDIVDSFCLKDFLNPYKKLSCSNVPDCCDLRKCKALHGIGTMNTPKRLETGQTDEFNDSVVPVSGDKSPTKFVKQTSHRNPGNKSSSPTEESKKISDTGLRDIVDSFCLKDFLNPYKKLSCSKVPDCCDLRKCKALHGMSRPTELGSYRYGHVFNILDSPLDEWLCDILPTLSLFLNTKYHLRGDMLRVMFDYVLNGPNESLMWDIKAILDTHWSLHPPCSEHMRNLYLELFQRPYRRESYFKRNLVDCGVFLHVLDQMDKILLPKSDAQNAHKSNNEPDEEEQNFNCSPKEVTFEVLEDRFNNQEPLLGEERQEAMDSFDELANSLIKQEPIPLEESEFLNRLTIALEVIVDLLEADFMICVSRLKDSMKGICKTREPLIKVFVNDDFCQRILRLYVSTTNKDTWKQLSRLIGLMAETIHLFKHGGLKVWKYPNLTVECEEFSSSVYEEFIKGDWDESERLSRLQSLRPPWLQQTVTLAVVNSHLNLDLASGIQAVVDIIHTHVISPEKLERDLVKIEPDPEELLLKKDKLMKKSRRKNMYGETLLHQMCQKQYSVEEVECVLALPETDVNAKDNYGWTPLHKAVHHRDLYKIELLLRFQPPAGSGRQGVDVGARNNDGTTPLHEAVEADSIDICHMLLPYGGICLLRKKNNEGVTPLMLARPRKEIIDYFEKVIKLHEALNLDSNSVLKLSNSMIRYCMLICEAFLKDHHTWDLYQMLKYDKNYERHAPEQCVAASSMDDLLEFENDQGHFRRLHKILEKLAENPENSYLIHVWKNRYLCMEDEVLVYGTT